MMQRCAANCPYDKDYLLYVAVTKRQFLYLYLICTCKWKADSRLDPVYYEHI